MEANLLFKYQTYDSMAILSRQWQQGSFFTYEQQSGASETIKVEAELVEWLFSNNTFKHMLFEELHLDKTPLYKLQLKKNLLLPNYRKGGDLDVLLYNYNHQLIGIEFKKVKAIIRHNDDNYINKIDGISDGVFQVNRLIDKGLHQCYLAILIIVDGRDKTDNNRFFRGLTDEMLSWVYHFDYREKLKDAAGLMFIELVQTTGSPLHESGTIGICVEKYANPQDQSVEITNRFKLNYSHIPNSHY